jgi:uncharacterized membrane protein (DUF485 family)
MKEIKPVDDGLNNIPEKTSEEMERELTLLKRNSRFARIAAVTFCLFLIILWPLPMYESSYVFSKSFFTGWVIVAIIWMFISFCIVGIYPVVEGRQSIMSVCKKIYADMTKTNENTIYNKAGHAIHNAEMNNIA